MTRSKFTFNALAWATLALTLIAGCASLGLEPAQLLDERIAYAVGVNSGLRNAAANSLANHQIDSNDAEYVLGVTDNTRTFLGAASLALGKGDTKTAEGRLLLALNMSDELQEYLNKKVAKDGR